MPKRSVKKRPLATAEWNEIKSTTALALPEARYGACPTLSASFIAAFYGNRYFATNFSVMNFNLMGASVVATLASSILTSSGGYTAPLLMLLILAVVTLVLILSIKKP